MIKLILADDHAVFRAGVAKVLGMEDSFRVIASCGDCARLYHATATFRGSIIIVASSLNANLAQVAARSRVAGSRVIVIAEDTHSPTQAEMVEICGLFYRDVGTAALIDCVRRVSRGEWVMHPSKSVPVLEDPVGSRVRDRLTPNEMKIVALIAEGCKNREIALCLGTSEQVIKNYLRNIFDKIGVSDRVELALFTIHHRMLAEATKAVSTLMGHRVHRAAWFDRPVNASDASLPSSAALGSPSFG